MGWPSFRLDQVAEVAAGNPAPQEPSDFTDDGSLFIRMQDVGRWHHTSNLTDSTDRVSADAISKHRLRLFPAGSVLIPKSGASVNLNHRAMLGCDAYVVSHLAVIVPDRRKLLPEYLYLWSLSYDPRSQAQTTSLPSLPLSLIKAAIIQVPPLPEQRRIVDLLSRAEGIVRLRREAEKKAAQLIPALFIDMFGDPATNPKGWPVTPTGGLVRLTNGRAFKPAEWSKEGTPIIRIQNLNDPAKPFNYYAGELPEKYKVRSGDILLSWSGTPGTSFGCFRWKRQDGWLNQHIFKVEVDDGVDEEFFIHQINLRLPELIDRAHGGVGLQHFTKGELESLPFITPPLHAQQRFREQAEQALSIHDQQLSANAKAQAAFNALLARAFAG